MLICSLSAGSSSEASLGCIQDPEEGTNPHPLGFHKSLGNNAFQCHTAKCSSGGSPPPLSVSDHQIRPAEEVSQVKLSRRRGYSAGRGQLWGSCLSS